MSMLEKIIALMSRIDCKKSIQLSTRIYLTCMIFSNMAKTKPTRQKNKNNKTKPANLLKKEYVKSFEELKKSIREKKKT